MPQLVRVEALVSVLPAATKHYETLKVVLMIVTAVGLVVVAYVLGCMNTGWLLVRIRTGTDLRLRGSGTLGARNTGRVLGAGGFVVAMVGDMLKGAVAVWLAQGAGGSAAIAGAALVSAVAGHMYPAQLSFHGGKGLATACGGLAVLAPSALIPSALATGAVLALTRQPGAAAVVGAIILPVAALFLAPSAPLTTTVMLAVLLVLRHLHSTAPSAAPVIAVPSSTTVASNTPAAGEAS